MVVPTNKKLSNEKDKIKKKNEGELFFLKVMELAITSFCFFFFKKLLPRGLENLWMAAPWWLVMAAIELASFFFFVLKV